MGRIWLKALSVLVISVASIVGIRIVLKGFLNCHP
jgi:hypothetical protein